MSIAPHSPRRFTRNLLALSVFAAQSLVSQSLLADNLPEVSVEETAWPLSVSHDISAEQIHAADSAEAVSAPRADL